MSDVEIARYLGVVASSVKYWRDKLGLETNYHNYKNKKSLLAQAIKK
jgi:hypothetical protein